MRRCARPLVIAAVAFALAIATKGAEGRFPETGSASAHRHHHHTVRSRGRVISGAQTLANGQGLITFEVPEAFAEGG